jgi:hypothetical protein
VEGEGRTYGKAERYMDGGNHPLEGNYAQHDPWSPALFLEENVTASPAKRRVYAW